MTRDEQDDDADEAHDRAFAAFVAAAEPRLRRALVATYGPVDGREAALDALSWAWQHWDRLAAMDNPVGYLFRVGQTSARRRARRDDRERTGAEAEPSTGPDEPDVELASALEALSEQQRTAVLLVHGYGVPLREAADTMSVSVATVREHTRRALERLRAAVEVADA